MAATAPEVFYPLILYIKLKIYTLLGLKEVHTDLFPIRPKVSHISLLVIQKCEENNNEFIMLPLNSIHL